MCVVALDGGDVVDVPAAACERIGPQLSNTEHMISKSVLIGSDESECGLGYDHLRPPGKYSEDNLPQGPRGALFKGLLPEIAPLLAALEAVAKSRRKSMSQVRLQGWAVLWM
jgi:hypothetical protein